MNAGSSWANIAMICGKIEVVINFYQRLRAKNPHCNRCFKAIVFLLTGQITVCEGDKLGLCALLVISLLPGFAKGGMDV